MRRTVVLPLAICGAVLGAALLVNGIAEGAVLFAALPLALLRRANKAPLDRSAVRLALRLARLGQRTLLVESGERMQVVRAAEASRGPALQYVAALGPLILARVQGSAPAARRRP